MYTKLPVCEKIRSRLESGGLLTAIQLFRYW
jgi:hypothetical protein